MITKSELIEMRGCGDLHYTGKHDCTRTIGPRGGVTESITTVRLSGQCKTWKRDPEKFHQPIKYGLYESWYIDQHNQADFHKHSDCPLNN